MPAADFDPHYALQRVYERAGDDERRLLGPALVGEGPAREAYVTWLRGHDPGRAEALGLAAALDGADDPAGAERLQALLSAIDPAWWWLMQRARIQNCGAARAAPPRVRFQFVCPREWASLRPTGDPRARACDECGEVVHRCASLGEASERARRGECIAVEPAMAREAVRAEGLLVLGRPDYLSMWARGLFPDG
ncbi:MAG: hypothetical protein H6711_04165 [Myxococcales bacterium]|nr:hypothetical protein [Myxococcales bacterium]